MLAEFDSLDDVLVAADAWWSAPPPGVIDVVPAARTVLVVHDGTLDVGSLVVPPRGASPIAHRGRSTGEEVVIDVRYDGADLATVATACGLSIDEVVRQHSEATYSVAFCGFMPGFAYLVGLPTRLRLPRRSTPRTRVPEGSLAIADEYCGIYPSESPGGWHLLGSTDAVLWDDSREQSALLPPGTTVRFVAR